MINHTIDEFLSADECLNLLRNGFNRLRGRIPSNKAGSPYLPLTSISELIAQTFYMNFYEVNIIFDKYLDLWSKNCTAHFVQLSTIVSAFKLYNFGFVDKFFPTNFISYNQFFQFVCVMSLFDFQQIVSLMIGICRIQSNVIITHDQIIEIIRIFDKDRLTNLSDFFCDNMISVPDTKRKTYSLKAFITFINNNKTLQNNFMKIQNSLVNQILTEEHKNTILNRFQFYTLCKKGSISNELIPKESCFNRFKRRMTGEPPPYHYDYILSNNKTEFLYSENNIDVLVLLIKQNYGYGYRTPKSSKVKLGTRNSTSLSVDLSTDSYLNNNSYNNNCNRNSTYSPSLSTSPVSGSDRERFVLRNKFNSKKQIFKSFHSIKVINVNHIPCSPIHNFNQSQRSSNVSPHHDLTPKS